MKVTELPYNQFIGIKNSQNEEYLLELDESPNYLNHLGNVHASAQLSPAEAASGEFLLDQCKDISDMLIPVVRRLESKFKKPANGKIFAKARTAPDVLETFKKDLGFKGRSLIKVEVVIEDYNHVAVMTTLVEWYVQKVPGK